ncbi:unnamed protein product [Adineta steineri]|uniref:SGNH hydrolase-type esterase domain-containing protein n=1 Tax=Adineta steineri TaxID=433720 RepID=A0A814JLG2_9BILA|nr:unnamed protein product [Adineta steineri]CAF1103258.1 unnamed protein product [Adineta steineri]
MNDIDIYIQPINDNKLKSSLIFNNKIQSSLPRRFLAIGDSLTAGYSDRGLSFHSYSINLTNLFSSVHIPIIVDQQGVTGEHVVPTMMKRLERILSNKTKSYYDWIIILGGTNDLAYNKNADKIFNEGLKLMYNMVLQNTRLAVMTVIENGHYLPEHKQDKERRILNTMIRNFTENYEDKKRICLIDLDKKIPYHSMKDISQRKAIWDDPIHLKAAGYDQMAKFIFEKLYKKIKQ